MQILESILSLFYPRLCYACGNPLFKNEEILCTFCLFHLPKTNYHLESDNPISLTFRGRVHIEYASSYLYFTKGGNTQNLMHQFKYKGRKEVGIYLGKQFGWQLKRSIYFTNLDFIVPVPLHPKKQRLRGYNQSEQIALGLSIALNIPINNDILLRVKHSESQTRKTRYERWQNVENIFELQNEDVLQNAHVLLVDDVLTTGATLEACAATIKRAGNVKVSIATLAFADS